MNLLKKEEYQLWADGSGLHWAILEHPELRKVCYDGDDAGVRSPVEKQPQLTKNSEAFKRAIEKCGVVYADFQSFQVCRKKQGGAPESGGKPLRRLKIRSGFVVSNYYMRTKRG